MSRVWATSVRNCFWIRNRRLPTLELPSIKNDKSTLQPEKRKKTVILLLSLRSRPTHSLLPQPELPEIAMKRKLKKKKKVAGCKIYLFIYIHSRFSLGTKITDTWVGTYFCGCCRILCISYSYRLQKPDLQVKSKKALRMVS